MKLDQKTEQILIRLCYVLIYAQVLLLSLRVRHICLFNSGDSRRELVVILTP